MSDEISELISAGRNSEAGARCLRVLEALDDESGLSEWREVFGLVFGGAKGLALAGSSEEALKVVEQIRVRFGAAPDWSLRGRAVAALMLGADIRLRLGREAEAIADYDDALALVSLSDELERRGVGVNLFLAKARVLGALGRHDEAIVVLDGALSALRAAPAVKDVVRARQAAIATISKLDAYCALERLEEARGLGAVLSESLAGVPTRSCGAGSEMEAASEASLAAALAEIINDGDCWSFFEGVAKLPLGLAGERAMRLYGLSASWASAAAMGAISPVDLAAVIVRDVADGYALLCVRWSDAARNTLPLPKRGEVPRQQLIHEYAVDVWAREQGHPLSLPDAVTSSVEAHEVTSLPRVVSESELDEKGFLQTVVKLLFIYEIVEIVSMAPGGREALRDKVFRVVASDYLRAIRGWIRRLGWSERPDGRSEALLVCHLVAQMLFVASHSESDASAAAHIPAAQLTVVLHENGGYDWLADRNIPLPDWIS